MYVPKKGNQVSLNPARAINIDHIFPSGIFAILEDIDARYILVSRNFAAELFESGNMVSAIEIDLHENASEKRVKQQLSNILGSGFHVKNKEEQHELVFKTMKSEKWVVYAILVFILVLASGNMIGNLTMLYIDKKDDIIILQSMGFPAKQVNRIFLYQGWLLTFTGAIIGTVLGLLVCWLQLEFELLKLPAGTFAISAYPIKIISSDVALSLFAVMMVGFFASWYPVKFMAPKTFLESNIS
jgi:lipoprotein-releasing system permease protein